MSGVPTAREVLTTLNIRDFIQFGGERPTNKPAYYGADAQYLVVDSITIPESGTVAPVWVPDPHSTAGRYRLVARTVAAPGSLPKATVTLLEKHGFVPRQLGRIVAVRKSEACAGRAGFCTDGGNTLLDFHARVRPWFTSENGVSASVSAEGKPPPLQAMRIVP